MLKHIFDRVRELINTAKKLKPSADSSLYQCNLHQRSDLEALAGFLKRDCHPLEWQSGGLAYSRYIALQPDAEEEVRAILQSSNHHPTGLSAATNLVCDCGRPRP